MATARRWYIAASAAGVLVMLGRLGVTDRPFILNLAGDVAMGFVLVLLLALLVGVPLLIVMALVMGLEALFGRTKETATPPVPAGLPGGKEAA